VQRSPALLCGLAGDTEPGADLGPPVASAAQALDRLGYRAVEFIGEPGLEGECFDVAVCDPAAVGAQDAPDEGPYSSFSTCRPGRFGVNPVLTLSGLAGWIAGDGLSGWLTACRGLVGRSSWASMAASFRLPGRGVEVPHPIAAGNRPSREGYTIGSG